MDKAQLILYGAATYLAIKSLVSLMSDYRQQYKRKLVDELKAAQHAAPKGTQTAATASPKAAVPAPLPAASPVANGAKPEQPAKKAG